MMIPDKTPYLACWLVPCWSPASNLADHTFLFVETGAIAIQQTLHHNVCIEFHVLSVPRPTKISSNSDYPPGSRKFEKKGNFPPATSQEPNSTPRGYTCIATTRQSARRVTSVLLTIPAGAPSPRNTQLLKYTAVK